jgi:hypothetical protein
MEGDMKARLLLFLCVFTITILFVFGISNIAASVQHNQWGVPDSPVHYSIDNSFVAEASSHLKTILFIENVGQFDPKARYQVNGSNSVAVQKLWDRSVARTKRGFRHQLQ